MSEEEIGLKERITSAAGVITAAAAFITAAGSFVDNFPLKEFEKASPAAWWCTIILILLAGVCLFTKGRAKSSRLISPEAFSLKADNPRHLKGRDHDIKTLSNLCEQNALVFLEGESGAGKSALLRSGLIPMLDAQGGLYPFLLDVWGEDWESGPMNGLAGGLLRSLSEADRKTFGLKNLPSFSETISILASFRQTLGRTPVLIFDQFDDYQILHRAHFLQGRSTWLTVNELCSSNRFWSQIRDLLKDSDIRCLFVTSADTSGGLGSVRFVTARTYRLDRLDSVFVSPLLDELIHSGADGKSVISHPGNGWDRLKERLAKDLTTDGVVLPIQLRTALLAIGSLRDLTVRSYQKAGALRGIEAEYIEDNVSRAARQSGLTKAQVRVLLITLIDPDGIKTIPKSLGDLSTTTCSDRATPSGHSSSLCTAALEVLEQREILRRRSDLEALQDVWLLYHDYLCRGVTAASRMANRWAVLVEERFEQFRDASSLWGQWKALLNPLSQLILFYQQCCGNFRYAKFQSYAALSLLRFFPYVLLCFMLGSGIRLAMNLRAQKRAQAVLDILTESENLTLKEMQSLSALANANPEIKRRFLVQLLASPDAAARGYNKIDSIIIATTGLDPDGRWREYLFRDLVKPSLRSAYSPEVGKLCVGFYARLSYLDIELDHVVAKELMRIPLDAKEACRAARRLEEVSAAEAAGVLISLMTKASDVNNSSAKPPSSFLADVFCALATRLSSTDAQEESKELVSLMWKADKAAAYSELASLGKAFSAVAPKADRTTVHEAAAVLVTTMGRSLDRPELDALLEAFVAFSKQLDNEHSQEVAASIIPQMKRAAADKNYYSLSCHVKAFCAVPAARDTENSHSVAEMLLNAMQDPDISPHELAKLAEAFGTVAGDGDFRNAQTAAQLLIKAMQKSEEDSFSVRGHWLAGSFATIAKKLDEPGAGVVAKTLISYIERPETRIKFIASNLLVDVLPDIAGKLDQADSLQVAEPLYSAMEKPENVLQVSSLAKAFSAVVGKLAQKDSQKMAKRIIDTMEKQTEAVDVPRQTAGLDIQTPSGDFGSLTSLATAVSPMAAKMDPNDAERLAVLLIGAMQKSGIDENSLALLVEPFSNICKKVNPDYSWQAVKLLMRYIQNAPSESPNSIEPSPAITTAFCTLAAKLDAKGSKQATEFLVNEMERASNPHVLDSLAKVLESLPEVESPSRLVEFLKVPSCVGPCRSSILRILERYTGQNFDDDVWRFVQWVKTSHREREFDLSSPPNRVASQFGQSPRSLEY